MVKWEETTQRYVDRTERYYLKAIASADGTLGGQRNGLGHILSLFNYARFLKNYRCNNNRIKSIGKSQKSVSDPMHNKYSGENPISVAKEYYERAISAAKAEVQAAIARLKEDTRKRLKISKEHKRRMHLANRANTPMRRFVTLGVKPTKTSAPSSD